MLTNLKTIYRNSTHSALIFLLNDTLPVHEHIWLDRSWVGPCPRPEVQITRTTFWKYVPLQYLSSEDGINPRLEISCVFCILEAVDARQYNGDENISVHVFLLTTQNSCFMNMRRYISYLWLAQRLAYRSLDELPVNFKITCHCGNTSPNIIRVITSGWHLQGM